MSTTGTTTTPSWSDIVNSFVGAIQSVLSAVANFIQSNASTIADVVMGIGLAYGVYNLVKRFFPGISRVLGAFSL